MFVRIYLAAVAALYLVLAAWCSVSPTVTSQKVGLSLNGDSGKSEFLTVYGGLEFGLALILLIPLVNPDAARFSLLSCILIHASLVTFRGVSFFFYCNYGSTTGNLAIGERVILLASVAVWFTFRNAAELAR